MVTLEQIKKAKRMWDGGFTSGQIMKELNLSIEEEATITLFAVNLSDEEIYSKIRLIKPGMKSKEIENILRGN